MSDLAFDNECLTNENYNLRDLIDELESRLADAEAECRALRKFVYRVADGAYTSDEHLLHIEANRIVERCGIDQSCMEYDDNGGRTGAKVP